jgi:HD-GYP domain-containing protein (c-di-GMP phosphodiesterase class II)
MELKELKNFLAHLTPISHLQYQVWDLNGHMLYPDPDQNVGDPAFSQSIQRLTTKVIKENSYQHDILAGHQFMCGYPLANGKGPFGSLIAYEAETYAQGTDASNDPGVWQPTMEMEKFMASLANLLHETWEAREEVNDLAEELDQSFEDLFLYGKIASQIKTLKFSNTMLQSLINSLLINLRADAAFAVFTDKPEFNTLVAQQHLNKRLRNDMDFYQKLIDAIPAEVIDAGDKYYIVNRSGSNPTYKPLSPTEFRFLTVRIEHEEGFYGWLGLVSFNMNEIFRQGELQLLVSLAEQLSVVIANTNLYQDLELFIINMVKSLVFAIEAKDVYTRGHSERVSRLCMQMGKQLGLQGKDLEALRWASILHDIGKIGIPETILNKPGSLTDEEFDVIKDHPAKGFEILKPVEQLVCSLPGILHHHERFDGKGYPSRLAGDQIPLAARIIAVADTFDAISSTRSYRSAKSYYKALAIVKEVAGSQLDPEIVSVFCKIVNEAGYLVGEVSYAN